MGVKNLSSDEAFNYWMMKASLVLLAGSESGACVDVYEGSALPRGVEDLRFK